MSRFLNLVLIILAMAGLNGCARSPRMDVLHGRWVRPDGGYVLEIRAAAEGGALEAAYFNPRPIHVAKAQASHAKGALRVLVELRDVNYPGSTYNLAYDPSTDTLTGTYYQAVDKETYPIVFSRQKP